MPDWNSVVAAGEVLAGVEQSTSYGTPALKVKGKLFARLREDGDTLVLWVDGDEQAALMESDPQTFFLTPHYEGNPVVLVRLSRVDGDELAELVTTSWYQRAPTKLRKAFDAQGE